MENSKFFLIVNLIAGQGRCKEIFPEVQKELDRYGIDYDLHYTNEPEEATDVARMGIESGFTHIVAVGGDGTVNEVANGVVGSNAALAVIPAGTGNDFIRMTGIPFDHRQAVKLLAQEHERLIDLGRVGTERYFVNGLGIGIDAQVARDVLKMQRMRGAPAYLYAAIKEVFRFRAFSVKLKGSDWTEEKSCISLGFSNGKYCGGGFKLAPLAEIDDGKIDIAAIGDFPKLERLIRLPQARKGEHLKLSRVSYHQDVKVNVSSDVKLIAHIDGEPYKLPKDEFSVTVAPKALRVLVP
ncbi:diacylglycerol kinase family lipid kinase [Candidatus Bipolaricaulota bacterium]|nr:diacylglycerol kinase family lipid kinase [Candidatus Bipolaricaulota bacterium]